MSERRWSDCSAYAPGYLLMDRVTDSDVLREAARLIALILGERSEYGPAAGASIAKAVASLADDLERTCGPK